MTGLIVGCGCVLCLYPVLARMHGKLPRVGPRVGNAIDGVLRGWRWTTPKLVVLAALAIVVALGLARLQVQDDVKALQQSPPELVSEEQRVRDLLGSGIETRFFLVSGDSAQAVLESEEHLTQSLDAAGAQWRHRVLPGCEHRRSVARASAAQSRVAGASMSTRRAGCSSR